VDYKNYKKLK